MGNCPDEEFSLVCCTMYAVIFEGLVVCGKQV